MKRLLVALAVLAGWSTAAAAEADLAARAIGDLKTLLPDYAIEQVDALTLKAGPPGHLDFEVHLDRIAAFCSANPDRCDSVLHDYVEKLAGAIKDRDKPVDAARLRATVRPARYVAELQREVEARRQGVTLITAPLAGELVAICYFDLPTTMRPVTSEDLATLGLTADAAMARCKANVRAALKPFDGEWQADTGNEAVRILGGQEYEASYILFPEIWAGLAGRFAGALIVAVPEQDVILYGPERGSEADALLQKVAREGARTAERPISTAVLRWTPQGWQAVAP